MLITPFFHGRTHWFWVSIYQHHNGTVHFQQVQAEAHACSRCLSILQTKSWVMYKLSVVEDVSIIRIYRAYKFWRLLCKLEGLVNQPWENFALCILRRVPKVSRTLFCSTCSEPVCCTWLMVVFRSTQAAQTRGMFVKGKWHFCLPNPEAILYGEEAQGSESRKLSELFAFTLAHPDQSPGIRSLPVALYNGSLRSIEHAAWEVNGSHIFNDMKVISAYYLPEYGQKAETFIDRNLALKTGYCS